MSSAPIARAIRRARRPGRPAGAAGTRRAWRRRGRKAQVSAVATILGLMLVVTFIANYLTTTLPADMTVNDIDHDLQVENEAGTFATYLEQASAHGVVGVQLTAPFVLGSSGLPPFAPADGGSIGPAVNGSSETVQIALAGPAAGALSRTSVGGDVVVQLLNSYSPQAQIAFDYGAVTLAQSGGLPTMVDPPPITYNNGSHIASIWMPVFSGTIPVESGIGAAVLAFTLTSVSTQSFPQGGYTLASGTPVTITIVTPYAEAWMAYLAKTSAFAGHFSCSGPSRVCSSTFGPNGPLGTIRIALPATSVSLEVATFALALS